MFGSKFKTKRIQCSKRINAHFKHFSQGDTFKFEINGIINGY